MTNAIDTMEAAIKNDWARATARRLAVAARMAPYNLTRRSMSFDRLKARGVPQTLVRYCQARGISLLGVERAYNVAFTEAR